MKYYVYIFLILIFSCAEIQENTEGLPYDFLISEGWINFEENSLDVAEELFLDVLDSEDSMVPYYSAAYLGLGWTKLYKAKESTNTLFWSYDLRLQADYYFKLILEECNDSNQDQICDDFDIPIELLNDAYAGLAYSNSLMAIHQDYNNYNNGEDSYTCDSDNEIYSSYSKCIEACELEMCSNTFLSLTESSLDYSEILLNNNPNYHFIHDMSNINSNSIHILRAQLYIDIDDYDLAQDELSQVDLSSSSITFNLEDYYDDDPYNSYARFLYVGFEGDNNSKYFFPMDTEAYYDCSYLCSDLDQAACNLSSCDWIIEDNIYPGIGEFVDENENGIYDEGEQLLGEFGSCEGGEFSDTIIDCESQCLFGECNLSYYLSTITRNFTPTLPCLDLIIDDINLEDQDIVQCLESFPTNNLEYKFAVQFPSSILEGYQCAIDESDIPTIYYSYEECLQSCNSGECEIVDFDYANCQSQTELEFIDGIGCIDSYMYLMEEFQNEECLYNDYRTVTVDQEILSITLDSSFGLCPSN